MGSGKGPWFCPESRLVIQGHLWPCGTIHHSKGSCLRAFAQVVPLPPASLSLFPFVYTLSIFKTCPCATIFKGAFFPPSSCSQPFHCTTKARCVHLINTLVTNSAAAQLLVSKSGALPARETFQGSGAILLCPQGWALSGTAAVPV